MENIPAVDDIVVPKKNVLFEVTTISKVLAAVLFIILPFVGFWVGYNFNTHSITTPVSTTPITVTENNISSAIKQTANNNLAGTCLSEEKGYRELKPSYNNSTYELVYIETSTSDTASTSYEEAFPYNPNCRISLIEKPYQGTPKVIVSDLLKLMIDQNLPDGLLGTPRPYIFSGDKLIFGGNGYEGAMGGFYSFDLKTQKFTALTDRRLNQPGTVALSPNNKLILIDKGDRNILIINTDTLTTKTILLPDINEGETVVASCEMGCNSKIGWINENIVWYAIYKRNDNYQNDFLRLSSIKLDTVEN